MSSDFCSGESLSFSGFRVILVLMRMLLVSQSWYSSLELIFSLTFVKRENKKAKQGLHPQHIYTYIYIYICVEGILVSSSHLYIQKMFDRMLALEHVE